MDGVKVKSLDELREHFTFEILDHYLSGRLEKWLITRNLNTYASNIRDLNEADEEILLLKYLCDIFGVPSDYEAVLTLFDRSLPVPEQPVRIRGELILNTESKENIEEPVTVAYALATLICLPLELALMTYNQPRDEKYFDFSDDQLAQLISENPNEPLLDIIKNKKLTKSAQDKLIDSGSELAKIALASNPFIKEEIQLKIARTGTSMIRAALALNPALSELVKKDYFSADIQSSSKRQYIEKLLSSYLVFRKQN